MASFISVSANSKHIDKIVEKAKSLKITVKDEISWGDGYKYSDETKRNVKTFTFTQALWDYIIELEPTVEEARKAKRAKSGHLLSASPEDLLKFAYDEPGKK